MKTAKNRTLPKPRNPVARSPLLGKGGAHAKTERARRHREKIELAKRARDPDAFE